MAGGDKAPFGDVTPALLACKRAARVETAAGWWVDRTGHIPRLEIIRCRARSSWDPVSERQKAALLYTGGVDGHKLHSGPTISTITPRYMTATRSQIWRTMVRS